VRGIISSENGKMKVKWNEEDTKNPRFAYSGVRHHGEWMVKNGLRRQQAQEKIAEMVKPYVSSGKIIEPGKTRRLLS
jgi:hypothetical protein